jgi:beta-glucosidase
MREDVELMAGLGLNAYRFSVSWPRVLPRGIGQANVRGLDVYDRLVDLLLEHGIRPFLTLYHWDLPQALQERGGWGSADAPKWFAEYASVVASRVGDRVRDWTTLNEPQVFAFAGHLAGSHAPGLTDWRLALRVVHTRCWPTARRRTRFAPSCAHRASGSPSTCTTAIRSRGCRTTRRAAVRMDGSQNRWVPRPVVRSRVPA